MAQTDEEILIDLLQQIKECEDGQIPQELELKVHQLSEKLKNKQNQQINIESLSSNILHNVASFMQPKEIIKFKSASQKLRAKLFRYIYQIRESLQSELNFQEEQLRDLHENPLQDNPEDLQKKKQFQAVLEETQAYALDVKDIQNLKSLKKPSPKLILLSESLCIIFGVAPEMKQDKGKKYPDYWQSCLKQLLANPRALLQMINNYDKDNISNAIIKKLKHCIEDPEFTPENMRSASAAAGGICQ